MISELNQTDFYKCKNLINQQGQIEVKAVVEGINPGRIFVDNIYSPDAGLVWLGNNDGFLFIGNESNEEFNSQINHFIDTMIQAEAEKVGLKWFEAMGNHQKWDVVIEKLFAHRKLESWNQKVYTLQKENFYAEDEPVIGQEFEVIKIDEELYYSNTLHNIDLLHSKILEYWSSTEQFFRLGTGYCIKNPNNIISICFSGFVIDDVHAVDIETLKAYGGNKLAQKLAHVFARDCLENDFTPYWDCMEDNNPSIAVAEKIGFTNIFNYKGYYFPLDRMKHI